MTGSAEAAAGEAAREAGEAEVGDVEGTARRRIDDVEDDAARRDTPSNAAAVDVARELWESIVRCWVGSGTWGYVCGGGRPGRRGRCVNSARQSGHR